MHSETRSLTILVVAILAGCGGGGDTSSSTPPPVTCGAATHDNGAHACVLDNFRVIVNPPNTYWSCGVSYNPTFYRFDEITATSGNGIYAPAAQSGKPQPLQSFTWNAISTDAVDLFRAGVSAAPFMTFTAIAPNASNTAFNYGAMSKCTLQNGVITPAP